VPFFLPSTFAIRAAEGCHQADSPKPATAELLLSRWRLAAQLSHPNCFTSWIRPLCLDDTNFLYVVMQLLRGSLANLRSAPSRRGGLATCSSPFSTLSSISHVRLDSRHVKPSKHSRQQRSVEAFQRYSFVHR